jgi:hypothetical protein
VVLRVFDTFRHSNVKRRAEYRRIGRNYKSLRQFKAERLRRLWVLELRRWGFSVRQVALLLNVSERTVNRDLAWVEPGVERWFLEMLRLLGEEEQVGVLGRLAGLCGEEEVGFIVGFLGGRRRVGVV